LGIENSSSVKLKIGKKYKHIKSYLGEQIEMSSIDANIFKDDSSLEENPLTGSDLIIDIA
jgi:hypothetical protein